jgi:hypothetical protein
MAGTEGETAAEEMQFRVVKYERFDRKETVLWSGTDLAQGVRLYRRDLEGCRLCDGEYTFVEKQQEDGSWRIHRIKDIIESKEVAKSAS